jgi:hypothetical protein
MKSKTIFFFLFAMIALRLSAQKGSDPTVQKNNRNSVRANKDKDRLITNIILYNPQGQQQILPISYTGAESKITAILYDALNVENSVPNVMSFSEDGKTLTINLSKKCPPICRDEHILEFVSGGKRTEFRLYNLQSWPPMVAQLQASQK